MKTKWNCQSCQRCQLRLLAIYIISILKSIIILINFVILIYIVSTFRIKILSTALVKRTSHISRIYLFIYLFIRLKYYFFDCFRRGNEKRFFFVLTVIHPLLYLLFRFSLIASSVSGGIYFSFELTTLSFFFYGCFLFRSDKASSAAVEFVVWKFTHWYPWWFKI